MHAQQSTHALNHVMQAAIHLDWWRNVSHAQLALLVVVAAMSVVVVRVSIPSVVVVRVPALHVQPVRHVRIPVPFQLHAYLAHTHSAIRRHASHAQKDISVTWRWDHRIHVSPERIVMI